LSSGLTKLAKAHNINLIKCSSVICKASRGLESLISTHPDIRKRIEKAANSPEGKKILKQEKDPVKAMIKLAKLAGVTDDDVKKTYEERDKKSVLTNVWAYLNKDVRDVFHLR